MSEPYIGEIRAIPYYSFIPDGWLLCDGTLYSVGQFTPLFSVIGSSFGGDNRNNFAVPNLKGRAIVGAGLAATGGQTQRVWSKNYGASTVALTEAQLPPHTHPMQFKRNALGFSGKTAAPDRNSNPAGFLSSTGTKYSAYQKAGTPNTTLSPQMVGPSGQSPAQGHGNLQPYQAFYFAIAHAGVFPVKA